MPHLRNRYISEIITKRLSFFPVVAIQGARQVGKSALVRDLLPEWVSNFSYETFDQLSAVNFARSGPESFLESKMVPGGTLAIDEAQKVPEIFDAVKFIVDRKRVPGQFILLGSTEFSKRTLIRESLTGRMAMVRLFPFTLAEALRLTHQVSESAFSLASTARATRQQLMKHLDNGGMPGAFHIRDSATRQVFFKEWIGLVILRDLMNFPKVKLNPTIAQGILEKIATLPEPSIGHIARELSIDPRRIRTHIECLEALFVVHKIEPFPGGAGQPLYLHCDVGLATYLGAPFARRLQTWAYQELLANREWSTDVHEKIFYYRTLKGGIIHFIVEGREHRTAVKILAKESVTLLDLKILEAFRQKFTDKPLRLVVLGASRRDFAEQHVNMYPWEAMV